MANPSLCNDILSIIPWKSKKILHYLSCTLCLNFNIQVYSGKNQYLTYIYQFDIESSRKCFQTSMITVRRKGKNYQEILDTTTSLEVALSVSSHFSFRFLVDMMSSFSQMWNISVCSWVARSLWSATIHPRKGSDVM